MGLYHWNATVAILVLLTHNGIKSHPRTWWG